MSGLERIAVCIALVAPCSALVAQKPSAFAQRSFVGGVPAQRASIGKVVAAVHGGELAAWSAFTRRWVSEPIGPSPTLVALNDVVIARDGVRFVAFSSMRGRFESLVAGSSAQLLNPASQNNDSIALVRDGNVLHAFSAFTGRWSARTFSSAAAIAVQRHVAIVVDGAIASGLDAFTGQWHDVALDGPVVHVSADGVAGFCATATTAYGFSALHGAWTSAPCSLLAQAHRNDDWVVWHDGAVALGYSGITNTFASASTGAFSSTQGDDLFGAFVTPGLVHAFSAVTGTWSVAPMASGATLRVSSACALVVDGPQLHAYSAPLGSFIPLALDVSNEAVAGCVVAVQERATARPWLFSALTGHWSAAPIVAAPSMPRLSTTGALLSTNGGALAFSARSGSFVPLAATLLTLEANESSAPMLAWDSAHVFFFDGRQDRWMSADRAGSGPIAPQIWRTSAFVQDGPGVLGFSTQGGVVERFALSAPLVSFRTNSESASLVTADSIVGFSGVPEPYGLSQFPEFRRVAVSGSPFRLQQRLLQNEIALLGFGPSLGSPLGIAGVGELLIDPASCATTLLAPEADADRAVFSTQIPADPVLRGVTIWFQALVADATGSAWLSDSSVLWIG